MHFRNLYQPLASQMLRYVFTRSNIRQVDFAEAPLISFSALLRIKRARVGDTLTSRATGNNAFRLNAASLAACVVMVAAQD